MTALFKDILPPDMVCVETSKHLKWARLFPEECEVIKNAGAKRRAEFITGRACAHEALQKLGFEGIPVPKGHFGAPLWPGQIVGSITHCSGFRAAAIARKSRHRAVGIDVEPNVPLPDGILATISTRFERAQQAYLRRLFASVATDRLLFSAKEAAFKCLFSAEVDIEDFTSIRVDIRRGRLIVKPPKRLPDAALHGKWLVRDSFICSSVTMDAYTPT